MQNSNDGVVRDVYSKPEGSFYMGFSALIAKKLGTRVPDELAPISFISKTLSGKPTFAAYPAHTVKNFPKEWFAGKIVLIGVDLPHSNQIRTPLTAAFRTSKVTIPSIILHAYALAQFLENQAVSKIGRLIGRLSVPAPIQVGILFVAFTGI